MTPSPNNSSHTKFVFTLLFRRIIHCRESVLVSTLSLSNSQVEIRETRRPVNMRGRGTSKHAHLDMNVFDSDNVYGGKTIPITQLASILIMTIACILFSGILLPTISHYSNRKVNRKSLIVLRITFRLITTRLRENLSVNQIHQNRTSPLLAGLFSRFFGVIIIELLKRAPSSNALLPS